MVTRRNFLYRLGAAAGTMLLSRQARGSLSQGKNAGLQEDVEIFHRVLEMADAQGLAAKSIGDAVEAIGMSFVGSPYVAHSLETPGEERLVVNLRGFDCVTFVESTLALARCVKLAGRGFEDFTQQLTTIRYRAGVLNGYASRLHYFSDWILDNEQKQVVRDVSRELGGRSVQETVDFMSAHRDSYPRLAEPALLDSIKAAEARLSARVRFFVERDHLEEASKQILPGDVLGMVPSVPGLDVTHTGLAIHRNGEIAFLHAPLSGGAVQSSAGSLLEYLARYPKTRGIVVARPLEVHKSGNP